MKPFNLEAAKRGEPIQTRAGTEVEFKKEADIVGMNSSAQRLGGRAYQIEIEE